jgi:hypothetical protein
VHMHDNPTIWRLCLMTDAAMYGAFVAKQEAEMNGAPEGAVVGA